MIVFFGITAYDMQKIRDLAESGTIELDKVHVYGAMDLYLDFINIFLRILSLFGRRR
ncbi:Inner membrane protein YbhL [compost metagenome]